MAFDLGEVLPDEIVAYLEAQMPAKCAAIESSTTPALKLPPPREYHIADPLERPNVGIDEPRLHVVVPRVAIPVWTRSGGVLSSQETSQQIWIWIIVADAEAPNLFRRRQRYARAVWELLVQGAASGAISATLDAAAEGVAPRVELDYSETLTREAEITADARMLVTFARKDTA